MFLILECLIIVCYFPNYYLMKKDNYVKYLSSCNAVLLSKLLVIDLNFTKIGFIDELILDSKLNHLSVTKGFMICTQI